MKSNFGILEMDKKNKVKKYNEKPSLNMWFNIGYIVFGNLKRATKVKLEILKNGEQF